MQKNQNNDKEGLNSNPAANVVVITGMSGAGISTVLKALEDLRYEVFDNFPISFIPDLYSQKQPFEDKNGIAIGVDTRTRGFSADKVLSVVQEIGARLVFITCDDAALYKRFTETRRRHPVAAERTVSYGIEKEREMLAPLKDNADIVIDSTDKSIHDLRHMLEGYFMPQSNENLTVSLISFGFRNGVPREADIVMDVRFLKNPHWDPDLRSKTGLDNDVGEYIKQDEGFEGFLGNFKGLVKPLLPRYMEEGKSYLTIAIGCTGGKHRSVFIIESLRKWLEDEQGIHAFAHHRDLPI